MIAPDLAETLRAAAAEATPAARIVVLTGAGISAESGVPTFRGSDGYWRVGSRNYHPQELATFAAFRSAPEIVWPWYLHRIGHCLAARPNPAHDAIAALQRAFGERSVLITQNVDGLHLRAGSDADHTWHIHGTLARARCADPETAACRAPRALPVDVGTTPWQSDRPLDPATAAALRCRNCGGWLRPHVLWFDEYYDEENFHFDSSLRAAMTARLLVVVGTSGATNLPNQIVAAALHGRIPVLVIDVEDTSFGAAAAASGPPRGWFVRGLASAVVPEVCRLLLGRASA